MSPRPHLEVGYVARAQGLRGEVTVKTFDPASETLLHVGRVRLQPRAAAAREVALVSARVAGKDLVLQLAGVSSRTEAEACVGATVFVYREDLEAPAEGEFFLGDLVGLSAVSESGRPLGAVREVADYGPVPNLVIVDGQGEELMVPFADDFVVEVSLAQNRVVVRPPEYVE